MKDAVPSSDVTQPSPSNQSDSSITSSARSAATASTSPPANGIVRDSSWLELEVCREFLRESCQRSSAECRYVHPSPSLLVKDGKVTCCFDFLKDRCTRDRCKYFHPPDEVKQRLVMAGKQYGQQMAFTTKPLLTTPYSPPVQAVPVPGGFPLTLPFMGVGNGYNPMLPPYPPFASPPPSSVPIVNVQMVDVCRDHDNGGCNRGELCRFAHPASHVRRNPNNTVSVCWNYMMGYCRHQQCWFYHPPPPSLGSPGYNCPNLGPVMSQAFVDSVIMSPLTSPHPLSPSLSGLPSVPLVSSHVAASLPSPVYMPAAAAPIIPVSGPGGKKVFGVPYFFPPSTPISSAPAPLPNLISLSKDSILPSREN